jgi:hypothetical protein
MSITEIPRAAWTAALNDFSTLHEGWLISVDVWTPEIGALPEIHDLPLLGVSADRNDNDGTVTISAMTSATGHVSHTIHGATSVALEKLTDGATAALHVESSGGVKTSLRFRAPAIPETVQW